MPCVCLVNTFTYRKTLKSRRGVGVKPPVVSTQSHLTQPSLAQAPVAAPASMSAAGGRLADGDDIHISHEYSAAQSTDQTPVPSEAPVITFNRPSVRMTRADLINAESKLGSTIFGPIPEGHRREFFHDQQNVWIWHEDWLDGHRTPHQMTVRYEVRTSGVYKKVSTGKYFRLEGEELENFRRATRAYLYVIKKYLYNRSTATFAAAKNRQHVH